MYNQTKNRSRFVNIGNKTLGLSRYDQPKGIDLMSHGRQNVRLKSQTSSRMGPDSLQIFQQQINTVLKGMKSYKSSRKTHKTQKSNEKTSIPSKKSIELKNQINEVKNMLQSNSQLKNMEDRLQKILIQLQKKQSKPNRNQENYNNQINPLLIQKPQQSIYYPPYMPQQYYYPQPPSHYYNQNRHRRRNKRGQDSEQSEQQQLLKAPKLSKKTSRASRKQGLGKNKEKIKTRLRIYLFVVAYTIFVRSQAKKLSSVRKNSLKKFWTEKFQSQVNNMKNWLLDSHKFSISIILQKKNLSFLFLQDKSFKIKEEKKKLIMQIITLGVNKMLQDVTPQKISLFSEIILNLCRRGSFAVSRFWTVADMEKICISQYYGFFRIDFNQEKFLIALLVFVKLLIFNLFLQPSKFDVANFPKKQEPLTTNMKLISSVYYLLAKDIIISYQTQQRDENIYKIGNWLQVKKQFIIQCCQPLIYGNAFPEDQEYISGLYKDQQIGQLRQLQSWATCQTKLKTIIEKLHIQMVNKGKMVKKNLKYKLYN